jgi:GntR family transcriptional regulator
MSPTGRTGIPAYARIQGTIQKRIESGQLKPGDPVESERFLARSYGVSLMTARHALVTLEREGMVERKRGSGTFVAPPKIHFNKLMSFTEQLAGRSLPCASKVICLKVVDDEHEIAARLALPSNSRLLKLERLRIGAGEPFALEACYFSAVEFGGMSRTALERGSLFSLLEREYGIEIAHADEEVDATLPDRASAKLLTIARDQPLLRIRQTIYSNRGKPTIYVLGLYRADRHVLRIRRFR